MKLVGKLGFDCQVMYVWFDALINYMSGVDGTDASKPLSRFWPASMHIVGKDEIEIVEVLQVCRWAKIIEHFTWLCRFEPKMLNIACMVRISPCKRLCRIYIICCALYIRHFLPIHTGWLIFTKNRAKHGGFLRQLSIARISTGFML